MFRVALQKCPAERVPMYPQHIWHGFIMFHFFSGTAEEVSTLRIWKQEAAALGDALERAEAWRVDRHSFVFHQWIRWEGRCLGTRCSFERGGVAVMFVLNISWFLRHRFVYIQLSWLLLGWQNFDLDKLAQTQDELKQSRLDSAQNAAKIHKLEEHNWTEGAWRDTIQMDKDGLCPSDQWFSGIFVGRWKLEVLHWLSSARTVVQQWQGKCQKRCKHWPSRKLAVDWKRFEPMIPSLELMHYNPVNLPACQESDLWSIWGHKHRLKKSQPRSGRQLKLSTSWLRCLGSCQKHPGLTFRAMLMLDILEQSHQHLQNLLIVCFTFCDFPCPKLQKLRPLPWLTRKSSRGLRSLQLPELILRTSVGKATDDTPDICHAMPEYITKIWW